MFRNTMSVYLALRDVAVASLPIVARDKKTGKKKKKEKRARDKRKKKKRAAFAR